MMEKRIPVSVITGSAGTNGEEFFHQIVEGRPDVPMTAIVSEQIARSPLESATLSVIPTSQGFKQLGQGCACCTVRSDLMSKIKRIAGEKSAEHILIQVPPTEDLDMIAKTFTVADDDGQQLSSLVHMRQLITVVNAEHMLGDLSDSDTRSLIERIRAASVIVIEGTSAMDESRSEQLTRTIRSLNLTAHILQNEPKSISLNTLKSLESEPNGAPNEQVWTCDVPLITIT